MIESPCGNLSIARTSILDVPWSPSNGLVAFTTKDAMAVIQVSMMYDTLLYNDEGTGQRPLRNLTATLPVDIPGKNKLLLDPCPSLFLTCDSVVQANTVYLSMLLLKSRPTSTVILLFSLSLTIAAKVSLVR